MSKNERLSLYDAMGIEQQLRPYLNKLCQEYWVAGSIRRLSETVGDIEIVVLPHNPQALYTRLDNLVEQGTIRKALYNTAHGFRPRWGDKLRCFKFMSATVELSIANEHNHGYILWLRTGPKDPNHYVMSQLDKDKAPLRFDSGYGWITEYKGSYPVYQTKLSIPTEEIFFNMLNLPFVFPEWRSETFYKSNWKATMTAAQLIKHKVPEPKQRKLL